jgi:S1-C subfamily serine protease
MYGALKASWFLALNLFFTVLLFSSSCLHAAEYSANSGSGNEIKKSVINQAKLASVTIESEISAYAYFCGSRKSAASGFVVDKKNGIICTNSHVVGGPCLYESYFVIFHNGKKVEAKPLYYDIWQDIAFLKVESSEIPLEVGQLMFAKNGSVREGDRVFSISNTERAAFSFNVGYLSSMYSASGMMPQHSYVVNYNQVGGSSGAAVLNDHGQIVAVNFASGQSYRLAVDSRYVQYLLKFISQGKTPIRKHTGALLNFYSLSDAVRYRAFPKDVSEKYMKENPLARGNVIEVDSSICGSPAAEFLCSGDIIWKINGVPIIADLCAFDHKVDESKGPITLSIYRYGKGFIEVQLNTYDVNKHKINKIVDFCSARFVSADCLIARYRGVKLGAVFCASLEGSSPFLIEGLGYGGECSFAVSEINSKNIESLDDLIQHAQRMKKEQSVGFMLKAESRFPYYPFGGAYIMANNGLLKDIKLKNDFKLEVHEFNDKEMNWVKTVK